MPWYIVVIGLILFFFYLFSGAMPVNIPTDKIILPLFQAGPLRMDWRDIIALAVVGITIWALWTGQLTAKEALVILGGILGGKILGKSN